MIGKKPQESVPGMTIDGQGNRGIGRDATGDTMTAQEANRGIRLTQYYQVLLLTLPCLISVGLSSEISHCANAGVTFEWTTCMVRKERSIGDTMAVNEYEKERLRNGTIWGRHDRGRYASGKRNKGTCSQPSRIQPDQRPQEACGRERKASMINPQ
jgi:hypothetical protein